MNNADAAAPGSSSAACQLPVADLVARLRLVVTATRAAAVAAGSSGVKMVFTGYAINVATPAGWSCAPLNATIAAEAAGTLVAENSDVVYAPMDKCCGGSETQWGDAQYLTDPAHMNKRGYCAAIGMQPHVQAATDKPGAFCRSVSLDRVVSTTRGARGAPCDTARPGTQAWITRRRRRKWRRPSSGQLPVLLLQ